MVCRTYRISARGPLACELPSVFLTIEMPYKRNCQIATADLGDHLYLQSIATLLQQASTSSPRAIYPETKGKTHSTLKTSQEPSPPQSSPSSPPYPAAKKPQYDAPVSKPDPAETQAVLRNHKPPGQPQTPAKG